MDKTGLNTKNIYSSKDHGQKSEKIAYKTGETSVNHTTRKDLAHRMYQDL